MVPVPDSSRMLIRSTAVGVLLSAITTVATFTSLAPELTFLRYPLLAAAMTAVAIAGWTTGRLPEFNRALWAYAPWWARLLWLAIIAAAMAVFASISLTETFPAVSGTQKVLETRGIGAVAAYFFLIAGLRGNVDVSLAKDEAKDEPKHEPKDETADHKATLEQGTTKQRPNRKTAG